MIGLRFFRSGHPGLAIQVEVAAPRAHALESMVGLQVRKAHQTG
jgi:hypothetical protein